MKLIKKDVLILVEHKVRELESACLLKYAFERRGYSVEVVSLFPCKESIPLKYSAKIIFFPWAYTNRCMRFIKCFLKYSPNARLVNLHQEQYEAQDSNACIPKDEAKKMYHIAWGERFKKELLECGCDPRLVCTPGSIRLDFFKSTLKKRFWDKEGLSEKFGIAKDKSWVLYIAGAEHLLEEYQRKQISLRNKNFAEKWDTGLQCRKDFLKYVVRYLEHNSDTIFIYRPHPSYANKDKEQLDLKQIKEKYPDNFYIISELAINNWLVNANVCMSYQSTSFVECYFAKAPYYLFRTKTLRKEIDFGLFENYEYRITSYDEFQKALKLDGYSDECLESILKEYYVLDDSYSYEKVVDYVLQNDSVMDLHLSEKVWIYNMVRATVKMAIRALSKVRFVKKWLLKRNDNRIFRIIDNTEDAFSKRDVFELERSIKKYLQ
ncbi:MAG: hypothetical protein HFI23_12640 [Lachnospiraceae bacterium]|nr:hypothetical protein [Lachnospiraceae bacterium]MCI9624162.1 hypothetical protein [Lachnospiraceae bacterium]